MRNAAKLVLSLLFGLLLVARPAMGVTAQDDAPVTPTPAPLTPYQLIDWMNRRRTGFGLRALAVDPILMGTAQSTADLMAAYEMTGHIGDVRGRVQAAGYGANDIPWATENYAVLPPDVDPLPMISQIWGDDVHSIPASNPYYKHIGAGVARAPSGAVYYVLHGAYTSNGIYKPQPTPAPGTPAPTAISQVVYAVRTATPGADGKLLHLVQPGQSLWSIAIAYGTHIEDLQRLNGMARDNQTIYMGRSLLVPTLAATPMPPAGTTGPIAGVDAQGAGPDAATPWPHAIQPAERPSAIVTSSPPATVTSAPSRAERLRQVENTIGTAVVVLFILGAGLMMVGLLVRR